MGYLLLILGLALWAGAHLFKRLAPARRGKMGDAGKGIVALVLLVSVVLMVIGYRGAEFVALWYPPEFLVHVNNLLMVVAFWFFALSSIDGTLAARVRHKQLTGVKAWAVAHLLVNGDLASIILFGGMLAWAVVQVIKINRAEPTWTRPANPTLAKDAIALVVGVVLLVIVGYVHNWLGYWPYSA